MKKNVRVKYLLVAAAAWSIGFSANAQIGYTNTFDASSSPFHYDFGNATNHSVIWASGPTYDAGGSPTSGSAELSWTWDYTGHGQGGAAFTADMIYPGQNWAGWTVSFDIYVDPSSTPGAYNDYGYFQVATRYTDNYNYGTTYFAKGLVGAGNVISTTGQWAHVSFVLDNSASSQAVRALTFDPYNGGDAINGPEIYYIDNLEVTPPPPGPTPPPTLSISKPTKGLNIFLSTEISTVYDRQSARLVPNTGRSWVGHATTGNPVSYSFTINSFPQATNSYGCGAYLFLIPNPASNGNFPDYSEANCVLVNVAQYSATNALMNIAYKINEPNGNAMIYGLAPYTNALGTGGGTNLETGSLGSVTNVEGTAVGTWTVKFTSDTNVTLITPNGNSNSFVIPPYNVGNFTESNGFNVYLGCQMNSAGAANQAVVYGNFAISGSVNPFSDNFLTDTVLNTNNWDNTVAANPSTVLIPPPSAAYWFAWTNSAIGFSLETGSNLTNLSAWTSPSNYPVLSFVGENQQLVDRSELPAGNVAFFNLIKRQFTQLQVLLPGETNAPATVTGKVGTPTPVSLSADSGYENVTVNAVDSTWHIVSGVSDTIHLTTTDGSAITPNDAPLANGTMTFGTGSLQPLTFVTVGSWTVTATNTTSTNHLTATSSPVTVNP